MGEDTSHLDQHLDRRLASPYYLQTATRVCLEDIFSVYDVLHDPGTFAFFASHLFSAGRRQPSAVVELLGLIVKLEELHTKVQVNISPPHLATTLIYYLSCRWILYLSGCVAASASEALKSLGTKVPFALELILLELEVGHYTGYIIIELLSDILAGWIPVSNSGVRSSGDSGGGGSGTKGRSGAKGVGSDTADTVAMVGDFGVGA